MTHPLSIGVNLLINVIVISLIVGVFHSNLWVSYATILILLGGLLVIFIYVSLLASNEIFNFSNYFFPIILISTIIFIIILINFNKLEVLTGTIDNHLKEININSIDWLTDFYSLELSNLTLFLIFYLLLTLLVVVFNTKKNHGTLRSSS